MQGATERVRALTERLAAAQSAAAEQQRRAACSDLPLAVSASATASASELSSCPKKLKKLKKVETVA